MDGGNTFMPWQYFATTNSECLNYFGISSLLQSFKDDTTVTCTTSYSQVPPFENGEVSTITPVEKIFMRVVSVFCCNKIKIIIEGVHGIRPCVALDVMSNSPFVSQANTKQFGGRI